MHKINKTCLYSLFSVCRPHPDVRSRIRGRCCYLLSITFSEPINSVISMNFECHPIDMLNVFFLLAVVNCSGFVHQAQQGSGWSSHQLIDRIDSGEFSFQGTSVWKLRACTGKMIYQKLQMKVGPQRKCTCWCMVVCLSLSAFVIF